MIRENALQNMAVQPDELADRQLTPPVPSPGEHAELPTEPPRDDKGFGPGGESVQPTDPEDDREAVDDEDAPSA